MAIRGLSHRLRWQWLGNRYQSSWVAGIYLLVVSALAFGMLGSVAGFANEPFVFPSLGASIFVIYYSALSNQASPRNIVCGQFIAVIAGAGALAVFGLTDSGPDTGSMTWSRIGALTLALCLTLAIMVWLRVPHAPAGATTLIVAAGLMTTPRQLGIIMLAVCVVVGWGLLINKAVGLPYPWWSPSRP